MKIKDLFEEKEKSLVGMTIDGKTLPIKDKWAGDFYCNNIKLTSLDGAPIHVNGSFYCNGNKLTSLKGAPTNIKDFYCNDNELTSLEGAPTHVGGDLNCDNNKLTSLEGASIYVNGSFSCYMNNLTSLKDVHKHLKHVGGNIDFRKTRKTSNPIKSHVLGLLLIDGLKSVELDDKVVEGILNKYLPVEGNPDDALMDCMRELIKTGKKEFAKI